MGGEAEIAVGQNGDGTDGFDGGAADGGVVRGGVNRYTLEVFGEDLPFTEKCFLINKLVASVGPLDTPPVSK